MAQVQDVISRLRRTLSQSEIARRTGIAQSKISRWEAGRVAAAAEEALTLVALAHELAKEDAAQGEDGRHPAATPRELSSITAAAAQAAHEVFHD